MQATAPAAPVAPGGDVDSILATLYPNDD